MYKCYEPQASCEPANGCHQMTFLTTRSAARILIINLRHRQTLLLTRAAVSSRGGQTRHERAAEIERKILLPGVPWPASLSLTLQIPMEHFLDECNALLQVAIFIHISNLTIKRKALHVLLQTQRPCTFGHHTFQSSVGKKDGDLFIYP